MGGTLTENGLTLDNRNDLIDKLEEGLKQIYGDSIKIDSNTQDGQLIALTAQNLVDIGELIAGIYNSFNPVLSSGINLDNISKLLFSTRKEGTFTRQTIQITTDRGGIFLQGLDSSFSDPLASSFAVKDSVGNEYYLITSIEISSPEVVELEFRSSVYGEIRSTVGDITIPITTIIGVVDIVNNDPPTLIGNREESDAEFRVRLSNSTANASTSWIEAMRGSLLSLVDVIDVLVLENRTDTIDVLGLLPHSIWVVMQGGAISDIANIIYQKKNAGCNLNGDISYNIDTGSIFTFIAKFSYSINIPIQVRFTLQKQTSDNTINIDVIKEHLETNVKYKIGQTATTQEIVNQTTLVLQENDYNYKVFGAELSRDGILWKDFLKIEDIKENFVVLAENINITIDEGS